MLISCALPAQTRAARVSTTSTLGARPSFLSSFDGDDFETDDYLPGNRCSRLCRLTNVLTRVPLQTRVTLLIFIESARFVRSQLVIGLVARFGETFFLRDAAQRDNETATLHSAILVWWAF